MHLKMKRLTLATTQCLGIGIVAVALPATSFAQEPKKVEKIEVTGSNIKRVDTETIAPVQIITREDIEKSTKSSVAELIRDLPINNGGSYNETFTNSFSPGASGVSFRGLGQKNTLVLLNGRRMANYGFAQNLQDTYVDLNSIPNSAVERIEVLKDGASAIYGSDAIGGVLNIILRRDYQGIELTGNIGTSTEGGLNEYKAALTIGVGDLAKDKYNVLAVLDFFHRDELLFSERDFVKDYDFRQYPGGLFSWSQSAATWVRPAPNSRVPLAGCGDGTRPGTVLPRQQFAAVGQTLTGNVCAYNPAPYLTAFPEADRFGALVQGTYNFSPSLTGYGEFLYSKSENSQHFTPAAVPSVAYNPLNGGVRPVLNTLPASNPNNPFGAASTLNYTFFEVGPRNADINADAYRFLAGLKGTVGSWDWDAAFFTAENKVEQINYNRVDAYTFATVRDNGTYNYAKPDPAMVNALRINPDRNSKSTLDGGDIKVTSELMQMPAGPLGFAAGIDYRREKIDDVPSSLLTSGAVIGQGSTATNGARNVTAGYFELNIPATKSIELQVAARQDKYSDFGSAFSPKGAFKWTPTPEFLFRGSASRGFRAPTLPEISPSNATFFINVVDPEQGSALVQTAGVFSGNPNLKAERSNNYTLGMVFEPTRDFNIGFDAYKINQKNVVNAPSFQYIVDNPDQFPGQVVRDPVTGALFYITSAYQNLSFVNTSGVDITMNKTFNLGAYGKAGIAANFNYLAHYWTSVAPDAPVEDYVDQNGYVELPRYSGNVVFDWSKGPWTAALTWRYSAGYDNVGANSNVLERIGSYQTWDLFGSYQWNKALKITGSVRNLADRLPPYDPNYATTKITYNFDMRGRYVQLGASYTFK